MDINRALTRLPQHKFRAILADPPWNYQAWSARGIDRSAQHHYDCLRIGDILNLDVRRIADLDCWLFLWATGPCLEHALFTMRAWGFEYSGIGFTWVKQSKSGHKWHVGLGHTTRHNAEFCLLGRRGKPPRNSASVRELMIAPVREHSRKPDETRARIEQFCDGPYLELFARSRRPNWRCLGDDVTRFQEAAE